MTLPRPSPRRPCGRAAYRTQQLLLGLRSAITPQEAAEVRALLGAAELPLFAAMEPRDRRHSMDMVRRLQANAPPPGPSPELLAAALLHDIGKGRLHVWDRVAFVLLGALAPRLRTRLATETGPRWRRAQWALLHHARIGAERLGSLGTHPRVVALVERHLDAGDGGDAELGWLQAADNAN